MKVYEQAAAAAQAAQGGDAGADAGAGKKDDIVDADFEEVKDDK
jgi:molecular chaperone DnaK